MFDVNEVALLIQHNINNYYIDAHGCWIHRNKPTTNGYVSLNYKKKFYLVHRLSYALYKGYIPKDMQVCHICDVPPCINPDHLFLGTQSDNMNNKYSKGRGKSNGVSQLTEDEIGFIIVLHEKGYSQRKIAEIVGVSHPTIGWHLRRVS